MSIRHLTWPVGETFRLALLPKRYALAVPLFRSLILAALLSACAPSLAPVEMRDTVVQPVPPGETLRVVIMGDQGTSLPDQHAVAKGMQATCKDAGCDLGFGLGDNFYPAGPTSTLSPLFKERFADLYGPLKIPFLMITGNHDETLVHGGDGANPAGAEVQIAYSKLKAQWVMPDRYYRAQVGDLLDVLAVDTTPLASMVPSRRAVERPGGSWEVMQRKWLAQQARESKAQWTVVLGHHPLYSNGKHGDAGAYDGWPSPLMRGDAVRSLYRAACQDIDIIFSGHDHALQLFAPQAECPGTWQVVSGAAGKVDGIQKGKRPAAFQQYRLPGFTWMKVTREELNLRFYTVNSEGVPALAFEQVIRK